MRPADLAGRPKLDEAMVARIRKLAAEHGLGPRVLAKRFGVSPATISNILTHARGWSDR